MNKLRKIPGTMKFSILLAPVLLLVSCAGYQLGETKPRSMARVKTIAVPMFSNSTLFPRAEAVATSAVAATLSNAMDVNAMRAGQRFETAISQPRGGRGEARVATEISEVPACVCVCVCLCVCVCVV